jgi:hypothetical protein
VIPVRYLQDTIRVSQGKKKGYNTMQGISENEMPIKSKRFIFRNTSQDCTHWKYSSDYSKNFFRGFYILWRTHDPTYTTQQANVWVYVMHVLDMLWVFRVCNMLLGMLCALWNIHNMEGYECKTCPSITQLFLGRKYEWGKGQIGGKILQQ